MRSRKYDVETIVNAIKAIDQGIPVSDICAHWRIAPATLYEWRALYHKMPVEAVSQIELLRRENAELRRNMEIYERDREVLMAVLRLQSQSVKERCFLVEWLLKHYHISVSRACRLIGISRALFLTRLSR
ncbi:transposase [Serratia ureilytica]|uniref:transposase n=1 Tax=Serratia ureilytica TaxID=300181 RepID=UPI0034DDC0F2|nr:transposase [Serratia ureilytica]